MGIRISPSIFPNNKIKEPYVSGPLGGACFNFTLFTWHKALEEITTGALKYFYPKVSKNNEILSKIMKLF